MGLLIDKTNETYYTYKFNKYEKDYLLALILFCEQLNDKGEIDNDALNDLKKVFLEE